MQSRRFRPRAVEPVYAVQQVVFDTRTQAFQKRILMQQISDHNDPRLLVTGRNHLAREPLMRLIPPFERFYGLEVFRVVRQNELRAEIRRAGCRGCFVPRMPP